MNSILEAITVIKKEYSQVWERILTEEYDADMFLQVCVMGEVVFELKILFINKAIYHEKKYHYN